MEIDDESKTDMPEDFQHRFWTPTGPRHVFLSYVHENKTIVDRLYKELRARGVPVWLDRNEITPGARWKDAIRSAIK